MPEPNSFDFEVYVEEIKIYKSPGIYIEQQKCLKHGEENFSRKSKTLLILFGKRRYFSRIGCSR